MLNMGMLCTIETEMMQENCKYMTCDSMLIPTSFRDCGHNNFSRQDCEIISVYPADDRCYLDPIKPCKFSERKQTAQ
jgi:hypothetical protein